jgi:hypothetical protein
MLATALVLDVVFSGVGLLSGCTDLGWYTAGQVGRPFLAPVTRLGLGKWEPSMVRSFDLRH